MSSSRSNSQANQTSNAIDRKIAADGNAVVVAEGGTYQTLDADLARSAIAAAESINADSLVLARGINADSLDLARELSQRGTETMARSLDTVRETTAGNNSLAEALAALAVNSAAPDTGTSKAMIQAGAAAVGLLVVSVAAVLIFRRK